jgi:hypothetical protein
MRGLSGLGELFALVIWAILIGGAIDVVMLRSAPPEDVATARAAGAWDYSPVVPSVDERRGSPLLDI